ncbi:serine/threonine protein kinase [Labilithrix luteola]|uniref:Serine/threonine protein kinase n=1 Tax=Labilithrix luteola TaxID=1391654 RepID=A0A0K1QBE4_9BACT|nr:serine/threonine-protein kinase [Labilithrix luteola]AKV03111.1 serine/threonine protein kinase [Labilithrix luteola]
MASAATAQKRTCPRCGGAFDQDAAFCPRDGTKLQPEGDAVVPADPYLGTVIGDDIEIRAVAGVGGMGRVYRAHQRRVDRDVAVKILHRELSSNTQLVQRFHREAKIASKLQHPHVVEMYLAGQLPDGALYIVMEYLDGLSLASALASAGGTMPLGRAIGIILQICDAVGEGHARGIVHRDLKPENVMLVRRAEIIDWAKVLDFGIAKVSLGEQSMETAAGHIFGTARYISPEGAQGAIVGTPGDVYSIATIFYQLLAGRTPFHADQPVGMLIQHIHETPPLLRSWPNAKDVPEPIANVVMTNLAKDPAQRAPNARAFATAIAAAASQAAIAYDNTGLASRFAGSAGESRPSASGIALAQALEPTLDDSFKPPPMPAITPADGPAVTQSDPSPPPTARTGSLVATPEPSKDRKHSLVVVVLAFLLGIAIAVIVTQQIAKHGEEAHRSYVAKTRRALAESRYVTPPGNNVKELVTAGLQRWPDDGDLAAIRSDAAHEMVTRSMAARSAGDVGGALALVRDAAQLDPTDHSARMLRGQYEDDLRALENGTMTTGSPRVLVTAPSMAKPSAPITIDVRILPGNSGPNAKVAAMTLTIFQNLRTTNGTVVALVPVGDAFHFKAEANAPALGSYDVVFEATVDGRAIRAERDLDVLE